MNTPNKLTVARMIMVPFLVIFLLTGWGGEANRYISLALFAAASITDWFDGHLARKYNLITNFGKFMDPLADKLLTMAAFVCLIETGDAAAWIVIIILGRELIITGMRQVAAAQGIVIAAGVTGKIKTITQMIAIPLLILDNWPCSIFAPAFPLDQIMLYIALAMTIISGAEYIMKNKQLFAQ